MGSVAPLIFKAKAVRLAGDDEGLPEFDAVAFGVGNPAEAAVVAVFAVGIDGDACGGELGEEFVEVVDAVVNHGLLWATFVAVAEVGGVFGEEGPDGTAGGVGDFVGLDSSSPEEGGSAVVGELDAEVFGIPGAEGFGVAGAKEDAADAGDSGHDYLHEIDDEYIQPCGRRVFSVFSRVERGQSPDQVTQGSRRRHNGFEDAYA